MKIERTELLEKLKNGMKSPLIKVIIGVRRCGKSYLLSNIFADYLKSIGIKDKNIIYIKLDELQFAKLRNPIELSTYIKEKLIVNEKCYVILDEIQECVDVINPALLDKNGKLLEGVKDGKQWITYHDVLNELLNNPMVDCYVTGSNSRLLSSDLPTEFRNRSYNIEVYPLSFKEIKEAFKEKEYDEVWDDYVTYGGMPLAVLDEDEKSRQKYLKDLFNGTYFKDIKDRYDLKDDTNIDKVTDIVASCIGSPLNPSKIEKTFKSNGVCSITDNTITNYLKHLENSFLIKEAKRYDVKGRKYINTLSKFYFLDTGLRNARLNFRQIEESHLMENIIYVELLRNGYLVDVGIVTTWRKEENKNKRVDYEIDFVVNNGNCKYYIQSALEMTLHDKIEQEKKSLINANDNFKKIIIVKGYKKPLYDDKGIIIIGLYNFLMNSKIIERI